MRPIDVQLMKSVARVGTPCLEVASDELVVAGDDLERHGLGCPQTLSTFGALSQMHDC